MGINHINVDVSNRFFPDVNKSILEYEFNGNEYDMVCSFQCLEHNPLQELDILIPHMMKFTRKYFYISVPYDGSYFSLNLKIRLPKINISKSFTLVPNWLVNPKINEQKLLDRIKTNSEDKYSPHWWEVGQKDLSRRQFLLKLENYGLTAIDVFHNKEFPNHLFYLLVKC